jgi:hypothetical protein
MSLPEGKRMGCCPVPIGSLLSVLPTEQIGSRVTLLSCIQGRPVWFQSGAPAILKFRGFSLFIHANVEIAC